MRCMMRLELTGGSCHMYVGRQDGNRSGFERRLRFGLTDCRARCSGQASGPCCVEKW